MNVPRPTRSRRLATLVVSVALAASLLAATPSEAQSSTVTIMKIQGDNHQSPLAGETVTTTGVVTAVAFGGFYVQDRHGDGDDNTSDGIFVSSSSAVSVGDAVTVTGVVEEDVPGGPASNNLSVTRIVGTATADSSGNHLPKPVEIGAGRKARTPPGVKVISENELPTNLQTDPAVFNPDVDGIDFYETLEGMYVEVDRPVASSATRQFNAFSSEVFTLPSRGRVAVPRNARTGRGGILLQPDPDNRGDQNPERVQIQFDGTIYPADPPAIEVGDKLRDVRGVVGYSFGNFEVNATEEVRFWSRRLHEQRTSLRPTRRQVTVASYNVLNLSPDASDDAQRAKLAEQIVHNLRSPDVIALQEIQDNSGEIDDGVTDADQTIAALVAAIAEAGGPTYEAFDVAPADNTSGGIPGGNIRNAYLYNADRVDLVDHYSLTSAELAARGLDPDAFAGTRDPLVGVFTFDDRPFTVVNNHLTSRFGSSPVFGGPQPFVQAGETERETQVAALNAYVDQLLADEPKASIMVTGDLNTFEWTNDLAEILPGDDEVLTNLMTTRALRWGDRKNRYTFIFEGNSQALDHFFVSDQLRKSWHSLDIVHVNVDFSRLASDVTASDHEPLVGRFKITSPPLPDPPTGGDTFRLQMLHASDLEGGVDALDRAGNFAAIVDKVEDDTGKSGEADASITLSAGDNYIPGPFFNAAADRAAFRDSGLFNEVYNELFATTEYDDLREGGGRVDVSIMNIVDFDASAIGNHEWDAGSDAFAEIIAAEFRDPAGPASDRWVGAQFPYLSANLDYSGDAAISPLATPGILPTTAFATGPAESAAGTPSPKVAPAAFIDVGGSERIGVVGATTPLLESISSPNGTTVIGPTSNDMPALAAVLQPQVDALTKLGINKIVLVSHLQQIALETELAGLLNGVDIIVAGGSDTLLANSDDALRPGDSAADQYPVITTDSGGTPTVIVSTDGEYSYVGRLVVDFDENGNLVADGGTGPLDGLNDIDLSVNGPIKTEEPEVVALWGSRDAAYAPGTKAELVQRLVDAVQAVVTTKDGNVVGETTVYLDGRRENVRTQETNLGNLSADANLAEARKVEAAVDLSLKNGGGIRAPIGEIDVDGNFLPPQANPLSGKLDGQVSQLDIENSLRFNNSLTLLTLTAAELQAVVEHAVAATAAGVTPGQFGQIGGARFTYDPAQAAGSRVVSLDLIDETGAVTESVIAGGAPVAPGDTYRIVTLNFLAGGGDSYPFPDLGLPSTNTVQLADALAGQPGASDFAPPGSEQDAFAEFMLANHAVGAGSPYDQAETPPADDTRIVSLG